MNCTTLFMICGSMSIRFMISIEPDLPYNWPFRRIWLLFDRFLHYVPSRFYNKKFQLYYNALGSIFHGFRSASLSRSSHRRYFPHALSLLWTSISLPTWGVLTNRFWFWVAFEGFLVSTSATRPIVSATWSLRRHSNLSIKLTSYHQSTSLLPQFGRPKVGIANHPCGLLPH